MTFKEFDAMLLVGATILIHTDHKNLTYSTSISDRILHQLNYIECFGPTYIHIVGDDNFLSKMLSYLRLDNKTTPPDAPLKRESSVNNFYFILDDNYELLECFLNLPDTDNLPFALDLKNIAQGQNNNPELW
jgi:hypothetical protein